MTRFQQFQKQLLIDRGFKIHEHRLGICEVAKRHMLDYMLSVCAYPDPNYLFAERALEEAQTCMWIAKIDIHTKHIKAEKYVWHNIDLDEFIYNALDPIKRAQYEGRLDALKDMKKSVQSCLPELPPNFIDNIEGSIQEMEFLLR